MPVVYKNNSMAECVNRGRNNEDLRQNLMPPRPLFSDVIIQGMKDHTRNEGSIKCIDLNSLPSQNEENCRTMSIHPSDNEELVTSVVDNLSNAVEAESKEYSDENSDDSKSNNYQQTSNIVAAENSQVPSMENVLYFLPVNYNKRNPWRRISGFHSSGHELISATYPARCSVKKLRFAQAKKPLNYLYSYFSVELLDCDEQSSITLGVSRKDYPSKLTPGKTAGSIGYCSDTGNILFRDIVQLDGPQFSRGDVIGCGIIYPSHYKRYADLSGDDNSDGMTDVVLTSLLNTKSVDFVCNVLNLNAQRNDSHDSAYGESVCDLKATGEELDYYNENFVESRIPVEVYFTYNMQVIGKVVSHIPIGGFYPTVHVFSYSAIKMSVDLNPPSS